MQIKDVKLAVVGLGYVGLPLAVEFGKKRPVGQQKAKGAYRGYIAYQRVAKSAANVHAEMFSRQAHTYNA